MTGAGVGLALSSAALYDTGYVLEKQALSALPPVPAGLVGLVRTVKTSPRWLAGFVAMLGGLAFQLMAFTEAPVSVVQPILAAGVVALVVLSHWILGERLGRRETAAAALVLVAVVAIAISTGADDEVARTVPAGRFGWAVGPVVLIAAVTAWAGHRHGERKALAKHHHRGLALLAAGAGLFYGVAAVSEKAVATQLVRHGLVAGAVGSLATGYPWLLVVATAAGLAVFQVGLQRHLASLIVPLANVVSGAFALAGAAVIFDERLLPGGWWALPRLIGFAAVAGAVCVLCLQPVGEAEEAGESVVQRPETPTAAEAALWS